MSPDSLIQILHVLCSTIADITFSLIWGLLFALAWRSLPAGTYLRLTRWLAVASLIFAFAQPLQLFLVTATMTGSTKVAEIIPQLHDVLDSTHAGRLLLPQFSAAILLFLVALLPLPRRIRLICSTVFLVTISLYKATAGHAASDGNFSVREISQFVHLVSIAIWSGGIMIAGWIALPRPDAATEKLGYALRLSQQSTLAVVLVFLSGLLNTWLGAEGTPKLLITTTWGFILMAKVVVVVAALVLGALNRLSLHVEDALQELGTLQRRIRLEAWLMLAILCLSGWLGNTSPIS